MLPTHKQKALAALKRLNGLSAKLQQMLEDDAYCPRVLEIALAMKGHIEHIQAQVLESHLHTCAPKHLASSKSRDGFIRELLTVIGLSKR
ncbi:hypothetical protein COU80_02785 [Candidatus Peregrinibacteria bacterium CG10_big_fil_rev_8_21_14_0_10_55_24]|nr:MAG: hypothetical protein COU80_02785 [Candidatus Peregrinibacteria bacterium CG10_big_fil_rev_8_21_14_0_10_55_24]